MTNSIPLNLPVPCYTVAGATQIWVGTGTVTSNVAVMEFLGWTRGGLQVTERPFMTELKSDMSGGEAGPPNDLLWLGEQHQIMAELGQYNPAILAKLARRVNASVTSRQPGLLVGCALAQFRVAFIALGFERNYTNVYIMEPIDYAPIGLAATFPRIFFTGFQDPANTDSLPWNTTITVTNSGSSPGTVT